MIHALKSVRRRLALFAFVVATLSPARSFAAMPDAATMLDYGFRGFTLGLEGGLAVGYLSTGDRYQDREWRKLVFGAGIGALAGLTTGFIIAVADVTSNSVPVGYYVLRDATYGSLLGALMGAVVGMLLWVDDGEPRDMLQGASYGVLFGAVAGIAYGIVEANNATSPGRRYGGEWRVSLAPMGTGRAAGMGASVATRF
jgi:hypothetical protein